MNPNTFFHSLVIPEVSSLLKRSSLKVFVGLFVCFVFSNLNQKDDHKLLLESSHMKTMIGALLDGGLLTEREQDK